MHRGVLVVEDDADIRETVQELLEQEGYQVHVARHGRHALSMLPSLPDLCLVIVDLLMPEMGGAEFVEALRSGAHQPRVPVVVMSASSTAEPPDGVRMIRKPVSVADFLNVVGHACPPA